MTSPWTVGTAVLATAVGLLPIFLLGSMAVLVQADLPFTNLDLGVAVALSFIASTLTAIPAGRIVRRLGPATTVRLASVISAVALIGIAFVSPSWAWIIAFVTLAGAGNAVSQAGANSVLFAGLDRRQLNLAFGLKEASIPISSLISGMALPLIGLTVGWRWAFLFAALLALSAFLMARQHESTGPGQPASSPAIRHVRLPVVVIAVAAGLGSAAVTASVPFLVGSLVQTGFETSAAGFMLGAGSIVAIATRLLAGWLGYRHGIEPLHLASVLLAFGSVGFALLGSAGYPIVPIVGTLLAFAGGWGWTGSLLAGIAQSVADAPYAALPMLQTGFSAGGVIGPLAFSAIVQYVSYSAGWFALAGAAFMSAILIAAGRSLMNRAMRAQLHGR